MLAHDALHRGEPEPGSLVVKNGSKMRSSVAESMPVPLSVTESTAYSPGRAITRFADSQVKFDLTAFANLLFQLRVGVRPLSDIGESERMREEVRQ